MLPIVQSAVDLVLPELAPLVDRWRLTTVDVAALGVLPHVTLLYPWAAGPVPVSALERLVRALHGVPPIELHFSALERFDGGVLFLSLEAESEERVKELARRVARAFPEHAPYGGQFSDPRPHVTVAKGSEQQLDVVEGEFRAAISLPLVINRDVVTVTEEQSDGSWVATHRVQLRI